MIGAARNAGRVGSTTSVASGSGGSFADVGTRRSAPAVYGDSSDTPAATAVDVYDVAMEDVPLPSLVMSDETAGADDSTSSTSAKRSYLEQEARHVASVTSLAAFAAQQTAARVDGLAREIEGVGKHFGDEVLPGATSQRATDVACDSASEELLTLLRRVTAHLEIAGERIAAHVGGERRRLTIVPSTAEVRQLT